jgi:hypothetical protein
MIHSVPKSEMVPKMPITCGRKLFVVVALDVAFRRSVSGQEARPR